MLDVLQKFKTLSPALRESVSSPEAVRAMGELEKKYGVKLAITVMKIMTKDIPWDNLVKYFVNQDQLDTAKAEALVKDLKVKVLGGAASYLGFKTAEQNTAEWLHSKKQEKAASFFFSPEDEAEAMEMSKKVGDNGPAKVELESKVDTVIAKANISFSSDLLRTRFRQIMKTYIMGIRTKAVTKQTMTKEVAAGGLNVDAYAADKILRIVDEAVKNTPSAPIAKPATSLDRRYEAEKKQSETGKTVTNKALERDIAYDFTALKDKEAKKPAETKVEPPKPKIEPKTTKEEKELPVDMEIKPIAPSQPNKIDKPAESPVDLIKRLSGAPAPAVVRPIPAPKPKKEVVMADIRRAGRNNGKIKIEDVKFVPKLMSPVDELAEMNIVNFNRLDKDAMKAVDVLEDKLGVLEKESYGMRLEGVAAWRRSPINRLYLDIGRVSIQTGRSVSEVIAEKLKAGEKTITEDQFNAIMAFNERIRY